MDIDKKINRIEYYLTHAGKNTEFEDACFIARAALTEMKQLKNCNLQDVSNNEVAVCSRCGAKTVSHPSKLCYGCWMLSDF